MNQARKFEKICDALADPQFYPHAVSQVERVDTHISVVFLTGQYVYKLKKPKSLEFLDFRKLSDRKYFCEQEVRLNQRLSSGIYKEVVFIGEDNEGRLSLVANGEVLEYAVKMVQLPDEKNFTVLLEKHLITPDEVEGLAQKLADFYREAKTSAHIATFGDPKLIRYNMEENFRQSRPFIEKLIRSEKWEFICQVSRSFLNDHDSLFRHRIETGKIKDGHGDLRCDHVYFADDIQIIDCIEFNDRFRYGDMALDVAFLIMDLEHRGHAHIAQQFLATSVKKMKDPEIYILLDFFATYRAMVRLKISCFTLEQTKKESQAAVVNDIKRYLNQAYYHAVLFGRPALWIFCGLPASGKSTLAEKTAKSLHMPLYASDVIRKQNQETPAPEVTAFDTGLYQPVLRGRVYAELLNLAQEQLKTGKSVALDATFTDAKWQGAAIQLAKDLDVNLMFIECTCDMETAKNRLKERENTSGKSDARLEHLEALLKWADPLTPQTPDSHAVIDTGQTVMDAFYETLSKAYALRRGQTRTLLDKLNDFGL